MAITEESGNKKEAPRERDASSQNSSTLSEQSRVLAAEMPREGLLWAFCAEIVPVRANAL